MFLRAIVLPLIVLLLSAACGGTAEPSQGDAPVSLRKDVLPTFVASCATSTTCHASANGALVFLGATAPSDASEVHRRLVKVPSTEMPAMPYVTPGDPANSYLVHKLDGDQDAYHAQCRAGDCGTQMPRSGPPLAPATRDRIRAWVQQGAADN